MVRSLVLALQVSVLLGAGTDEPFLYLGKPLSAWSAALRSEDVVVRRAAAKDVGVIALGVASVIG